MSIATRNRRATVYPFVTTNDAGYASSAYGAARGTFFCRFSQGVGTEGTTADQADHRERAVLEFAPSVTIRYDDMIELDGVQWKVEAINHRRRYPGAKIVTVYRSDDEPDAGTA